MQPAEQTAEQQAGPAAGNHDGPNLPPPAEPLVFVQYPREAHPEVWGGGLNLLMTGANEDRPGEAWVQAGMYPDGRQRLVQVNPGSSGLFGWGDARPDAPPARWGEGEGPDPWAEPNDEFPTADADDHADHHAHVDADEHAGRDDDSTMQTEHAGRDDDDDEDAPTRECCTTW